MFECFGTESYFIVWKPFAACPCIYRQGLNHKIVVAKRADPKNQTSTDLWGQLRARKSVGCNRCVALWSETKLNLQFPSHYIIQFNSIISLKIAI